MNIDQFAKIQYERVQNEFDSIIIVDSGAVKGTGKSVFSIKLCQSVCKIIDYKWTLELTVFNPSSEKIIKMVKELPRGVPIHIDEASQVAYKRDYQKEYQKDLMKFINICRKFGKIIVLNTPDFWDLDKDLRNLADFRVIIVKRGLAQVTGKSPNPDLKDKWLRDINIDIINNQIKRDITKLEKTREGIRRTPNFLYDIPFKKLDDETYYNYVQKSKEEEIKAFEHETDVYKVRSKVVEYNIIKLAKKLDMKPNDLTRMFNDTLFKSYYAKMMNKYQFTDNIVKKFKNNWKATGAVTED
jgi:hypothetical protein